MKLIKLIGFYMLIMLILFYLYPIGNTVAIDSEPRIDIATTPAKRLFEIENFKPGDWSTKTLNIENKGNIDFYYTLTSKYASGSKLPLQFKTLEPEDFYQQLLLKVEGDEGLLFDGKLSDFTGLEKRYLAAFTNEDLTLSVEFPWESGNEFQGLATSFVITLTAEGKVDSPPGPPGPPSDPPTDPPEPPYDSPPDTPIPPLGDSIEYPNLPANPPEALILADSDQAQDDLTGVTKEEKQLGLPSMLPKTGELNPLYFLIAGLTITLLGVFLIILVLKAQKSAVNRFNRKG